MSISEANRAWKDEGQKRREKQEQSRNLPSRWQGSVSEQLLLVIIGGNTLETGQDGVAYTASVTSVPSAYDPNEDDTFIDGIGRATLYRNGVEQEDKVLVINSDDGSFRNAAFENDPFATSGAISIPVSGGGTVQAYTLGT